MLKLDCKNCKTTNILLHARLQILSRHKNSSLQYATIAISHSTQVVSMNPRLVLGTNGAEVNF